MCGGSGAVRIEVERSLKAWALDSHNCPDRNSPEVGHMSRPDDSSKSLAELNGLEREFVKRVQNTLEIDIKDA